MEKGNGKIAIAIVAMFVVALSIVGVTYAYFTATVQGNDSSESVEVQAGELSIVYTNGTTLQARNVVPGWTSDGEHYYDSKWSSKLGQDGITYQITATNITDNPRKSDGSDPTDADGLANKATFTVANTAENDGDNAYIISLKKITNGITGDDLNRIWVTLYRGEEVVYSQKLVAGTGNATQVLSPSAETLAKGDPAKTYSVGLTYQNYTAGEQTAKGVALAATVEVIPVVNNGTTWVDADGQPVTFATGGTTTEPALEVAS